MHTFDDARAARAMRGRRSASLECGMDLACLSDRESARRVRPYHVACADLGAEQVILPGLTMPAHACTVFECPNTAVMSLRSPMSRLLFVTSRWRRPDRLLLSPAGSWRFLNRNGPLPHARGRQRGGRNALSSSPSCGRAIGRRSRDSARSNRDGTHRCGGCRAVGSS